MSAITLTAHGHKIVGNSYSRGSTMAGGRQVGYRLRCTCGWTTRINGPKREAEPYARDHLRDHAEAAT